MFAKLKKKLTIINYANKKAFINCSRIPTLIRGATKYETETIDSRQAQRRGTCLLLYTVMAQTMPSLFHLNNEPCAVILK